MVCIFIGGAVKNKTGDKMKKKQKSMVQVLFATAAAFAVYLLTALLFLHDTAIESDTAVSGVQKNRKSGNFCVLLECEELSHYCAVSVDFDNGSISATLFDSREEALGYGYSYDRSIKYTKSDEIDIIGFLGGIVIELENGYNGTISEENFQKGAQRIFGSRAVELSCQNRELRALIAYEILCAVCEYDMTEDDFAYIVGQCKTDISYADFCRHFKDIQKLSNNITVG